MHLSDTNHNNSVVARYDEFQSEAVSNLLLDFKEKRNGRYLLVIPTGGGKTYTAVKAINRMFSTGILNPEEDQVVWGAHRQELVIQASKTFDEYGANMPEEDFSDNVKVGMMAEIISHIKSNPGKVCLAVIDEAHHAAIKNITYGPLFQYPDLGILGLTATPSRHDGEPLDFEKESFSIGFPDLVERQLILSPVIDTVEGERFEEVFESGAIGFTGLENLDCPERDKKIIGKILSASSEYKKVIIYVASKDHVRNLHQRISSSELSNKYESVDYILGGNEYSGNDSDRNAFISRVKSYDRSIIINCDVLTEGYDDPTVNTVVMASPTRSKLVYMQAIGRCIRVDKDNALKKAYIVEVVDDLPNIRYRINNRWLFSEISDVLEPAVEDRTYSSAEDFRRALIETFNQFNVNYDNYDFPQWDGTMRYSLLLFRSYMGDGKYRHLPILIDGSNRSNVSNWFNFLSERLQGFHARSVNYSAAMRMARFDGIESLAGDVDRQLIYESMEESLKATALPADENVSVEPWITFVSFRFKSVDLAPEVSDFLENVVNKEQLKELILSRSYCSSDYLLKLPLPLASYIGMIVSAESFSEVKKMVDALYELENNEGDSDHLSKVDEILMSSVFPLETRYLATIPNVIRENLPYFIQLK